MQNLSLQLMHPDKLKSNFQRIKEFVENKKENSSKKPIKENRDHRSELSKVGLKNVHDGIRASINYTNKTIKENTMTGTIIPIKQIILEFTADHIRDNAGKYAAGTMLGLGAAAGYLAGDPEHGSNLFNHDDSINNSTVSHSNNVGPAHNASDFQKDLVNASITKNIDYHNDNKGLLGNLSNSANHFVNNMRAENKFNDLTQAQDEYNAIKNSDGSLLTGGQIAAIGAGGAGVLGLAAKLKRRR